jgi:hypothetical protein
MIRYRFSLLLAGMVAWGAGAYGQMPAISSFSPNGQLTCTNLQPGSLASVEWAPAATGPWNTNWAGFNAITVATNGTIQVLAPVTNSAGFFRVRGTPPGAVLPTIAATVPYFEMIEGEFMDFTVRLTAQPAASTVVSVAVTSTKARVSPATLTFTPANYAAPQSVTFQSLYSSQILNQSIGVRLTSPGLATNAFSIFVIDMML